MSKLLRARPRRGPSLDHVSANAVDGEPGAITYTQWLNERGAIEADLTVTKLDRRPLLGSSLRTPPIAMC